MVMKFVLLPWGPELVFTETSILGINPNTEKICSHVDIWDSLEKNDYFSPEALVDVIKQMQIYKTPDFETPKYKILKRTPNYERRIKVVKLSGSNGYKDVNLFLYFLNEYGSRDTFRELCSEPQPSQPSDDEFIITFGLISSSSNVRDANHIGKKTVDLISSSREKTKTLFGSNFKADY